jgi:hypothetical protein
MNNMNKNKLLVSFVGIFAFHAFSSSLSASFKDFKNDFREIRKKEQKKKKKREAEMKAFEKKRKEKEKKHREALKADPYYRTKLKENKAKRAKREKLTNEGYEILNRFMETIRQGVPLEKLEEALGYKLEQLKFYYTHVHRNDHLEKRKEKLCYNLLREAILTERWDVVEFILKLDEEKCLYYSRLDMEKEMQEKKTCEEFFLHSARMGDAPVFFFFLNRGVNIYCKDVWSLPDFPLPGGYSRYRETVRDFYDYGKNALGDDNLSNNEEGYRQIEEALGDIEAKGQKINDDDDDLSNLFGKIFEDEDECAVH